MSETSWPALSIRECLAESFAGEWGAEPLPGNARVLRATDIDDDGHVIGSGALRRLPIGKLTSRQLEDGDILLEGSGGGPDKPVGRVAFFDAAAHQDPAVCSNFFKTLRPNRRVAEPRFLWRKLMWFYRQPMLLTFQQQTTGIINLKFEEYLNAAIEVPDDLAEQRAIAQILDTLDTAIRETEALIDKLKAVKQGLLHDLLTRGIDANGQLRPPQSEVPQLYKESPLGWIPKEWEAGKVSNYLESEQGIKPGPFGSSIKKESYAETGFKVYGQEQVISGDQDFGDYFVPLRKYQELQDFSVKAGDVLISLVGTIGKVLVLKAPLQDGLINPRLMRLRPDQRIANSEFVGFLVASDFFVSQVFANAGGGTMPVINKRIISGIHAPVVPLTEQIAILKVKAAIDRRIDSEHLALAKLREQKSGLMDDLLTGRVRVTPLLESVQQAAAQIVQQAVGQMGA